ncbi:MAG: hypothetical protein ACLFPW_09910 [Spirochaetaceae bacterium]
MITEAPLQNVTLSSILRARYGNGPVSLPTRGGVYARLKHIQGIPSRGDGGFTVSRLRALDNLIDRLTRLKGMAPETSKSASAQQVDRQIEDLSKQLRQELATLDHSGFSAGWKDLFLGSLVNLLA